jgi:hypothetical protein
MDKKKLIYSAFGISDSSEMPMKEEKNYFEAESENLCKDMIKAIEKKDALALKIALKAFINYCEIQEDIGEME